MARSPVPKDGVTYTGTWTSDESFGKLDISITNPTTPVEFNFINRSWRFTKKAFPVMELAPYGLPNPRFYTCEDCN
jgi:hypothetical protein